MPSRISTSAATPRPMAGRRRPDVASLAAAREADPPIVPRRRRRRRRRRHRPSLIADGRFPPVRSAQELEAAQPAAAARAIASSSPRSSTRPVPDKPRSRHQLAPCRHRQRRGRPGKRARQEFVRARPARAWQAPGRRPAGASRPRHARGTDGNNIGICRAWPLPPALALGRATQCRSRRRPDRPALVASTAAARRGTDAFVLRDGAAGDRRGAASTTSPSPRQRRRSRAAPRPARFRRRVIAPTPDAAQGRSAPDAHGRRLHVEILPLNPKRGAPRFPGR